METTKEKQTIGGVLQDYAAIHALLDIFKVPRFNGDTQLILQGRVVKMRDDFRQRIAELEAALAEANTRADTERGNRQAAELNHDDFREACEAHSAWSWAERNGNSSTFDERMELCNYAQWLTEKALAAADGKTWEQAYSGVPHMVVWPSVYVGRAEQGQARTIVERLLGEWRAAIEANAAAENSAK